VSSISIDGQLREAAVAELTALECKKTGIVNLAPSQVLVQHQIEQFISHFMTNTFISPFNTLTTNIKSFYSQQRCYVSLITLHPGGIRTRVFSFLRQMRCPLCYAAAPGQSKQTIYLTHW
jgi:hypothetical protein